MKKIRSRKMEEKIIESAAETAGSYVGPLLIGAGLLGCGVLFGSIWYCLSGAEENGSLSADKNRRELCEKIKKLSDNFLITPHEHISLKSLRDAKKLCDSVREKFDLSLSDNYSLNTKLIKLEREIE